MLARFGLSATLALALSGITVHAQEWDAIKSAKGWARFDATGSATFYDPATQDLVTWMQDAGVLSRVNISKAEMTPERWVVDDDRIWIMAGNTMKQIGKNGKVERTTTLPAEVGDVDFLPPNGFVISYRTPLPFIERRDIKNGNEVWTFGKKPRKGEGTSKLLHRILRNGDMDVVLISGGDMTATLLKGKDGEVQGQSVFTYNGGVPPRLALGEKDRGPITWWWSKNIAFCAVPSSMLPSLNQQGLLLARLDFAASTVEFLPAGVTEEFHLAGILENRAVLVAPNGGIVFAPVK